MGKEKEIKRAGKFTYAIFFVFLMVFNFGLMKIMAGDPFKHFVLMSFLMNGILGMAFRTIYHTLAKKRDGKQS